MNNRFRVGDRIVIVIEDEWSRKLGLRKGSEGRIYRFNTRTDQVLLYGHLEWWLWTDNLRVGSKFWKEE